MSLRPLFLSFVAFACMCVVARAQTSVDANEGSRLIQNTNTGVYTFSWWGHAGRTYFLQQSDDLLTWTYLPVIESGAEQTIQWSFTSSQPRFFVRLKYADIPTDDPFNDDFDGDGVCNWDELQQGSDPLSAALDANGLSLDWEKFYNIPFGTNPNNAAPRGDGLSYLQAYQQGLNPNDSASDVLPSFYFATGYGESGTPGTVLPVPLSVQVYSARRYTAPLTFTVSSGTALLTTDSAGNNPSTTVTLPPLTPLVNSDGSTSYVAQLYIFLPDPSQRISTITVTGPRGTGTGSVSTQVFAFDPNLQPPNSLAVGKMDATSASLSWTPVDSTSTTNVEVSTDYGSTWKFATSFGPGVTTGTIPHLIPNQTVYVRLYTAGNTGGNSNLSGSSGRQEQQSSNSNDATPGSGPGSSETVTPLSVPVVLGQQQGPRTLHNYSWRGMLNGSTDRYKTSTILFDDGSYDPSNGHFGTYTYSQYLNHAQTWNSYWVSFSGDYPGGMPVEPWAPSSDTTNTRSYYTQDRFLPTSSTYPVTVTLSDIWTLDSFKADVENYPVTWFTYPNSSQFLLWDYTDTADIFYEDVGTDNSGVWVDTRDAQGNVYPGAEYGGWGYDHTYEVVKLKYKFRCNKDPNGVVVYDIIFTPEDGGDPIHDVHVIPTNGKTEVPDDALTIDPTQLNNKKNGTYRVVPIALQPDDWTDPSDDGDGSQTNALVSANDIAPDEGQTGVTGAMVDSNLGKNGQKHFVSPKKAGGFVVLRAELPKLMTVVDFDENFEWVQAPAGSPQYQLNGNKISIPRDTAGKYPIQIKAKKAGTIVDVMNVWIVSATMTADLARGHGSAIDGSPLGNASSRVIIQRNPDGTIAEAGYLPSVGIDWKATIQPQTIITDSDRPALEKQTRVSPPGVDGGVASSSNHDASGSGFSGWDISRQRQTRAAYGPTLIPTNASSGAYAPVDFPASDTEGNDDDNVNLDEDSDPYNAGRGIVGQLVDNDVPYFLHYDSRDALQQGGVGVDGDKLQFRTKFREFVRVQIGNKWYRCSESTDGLWRFFFDIQRTGGRWNLAPGTSIVFDLTNGD